MVQFDEEPEQDIQEEAPASHSFDGATYMEELCVRAWLIEARGKETRKSVAEKAGISQNFYSCIESGQRCPSPRVAQRIGMVLGIDWTRFFCDKQEAVS